MMNGGMKMRRLRRPRMSKWRPRPCVNLVNMFGVLRTVNVQKVLHDVKSFVKFPSYSA
jgi:hypothetical protein